jgi:hypothetical protein
MGERERELAKGGVEAFNAGNVETLVSMTHPECELRGMRYEVDGTRYRGPQGIRDFWRDATELWDEMQMLDPEILDGDERALVVCRFVLRGRGSGAEVEHELAWIIEMRDGLMSFGHTTLDVERARRWFEEK